MVVARVGDDGVRVEGEVARVWMVDARVEGGVARVWVVDARVRSRAARVPLQVNDQCYQVRNRNRCD